jgi:hypothetical protein
MEVQKLSWYDLQRAINQLPKIVHDYLKVQYGKVFVAGGYLRSIVTGEEINDIDLYTDGTIDPKWVATEIHTKKMLVGTSKLEDGDNAYTIISSDFPIQVIHRWNFPNTIDIITTFDFTIACAALWFNKETNKWDSCCHDAFYEDLAAKRLIYTKPPEDKQEPGATLLRVLKFYQKGYKIPLDSLSHIISRLVSEVDLDRLRSWECEDPLAHVILGMLREVDPNTNPDRNAYLPAFEE